MDDSDEPGLAIDEGALSEGRPDTPCSLDGDSKEALGVKIKRKGRRGRSSGSLTMKGDKITSFTTERGITYSPYDHVYIDNNRPNQPYFICSIQDFSVMKRDTLVVRVKWYYRVTEVPDCVYQHLVQDRFSQNVEGVEAAIDRTTKSRELFCSEATDTYPVTALRGKCRVVHCNTLEAARAFQPAADNFYCILGYNPETKRLATTQGQIRVGSMYQARLPEFKSNVAPKDMPERCEDREQFMWHPKSVQDGDLMMYLRAARSVAAFAGMCDGGSTEDGCQAASMDDTTINAMNMLHAYSYDTKRALQALVKAPALRTIDKKWNEEDTKRFVKGLRVYGKNFFKIRKELLPHRETGELVEYYYFWKKSPAAAANRPHRRHRRHGVKRATTRSQRPASSEFLDLSSASDSDNDSEDSDTLSGFRCQNCLVTVSKDWNNAGKTTQRLCSKCRIFFKKYGVDRPLENPGDSPYFQPVKDGDVNAHNMLTRQTRNSTDSKDKKKGGSNSISSLDNLDSPLSDSKKSLVPSSPSALSTSSSCSTDREKKKRRHSGSPSKDNKRHHPSSDSEDKFSKHILTEPSDSDSSSDSSISGAEETPNEADNETNQDELTSSSSPSTTPSPLDTDPLPIPVESTIGDKLADLPRPEPQHPSPNRQPLDLSPLSHSPVHIPTVPSQPASQGFVPLPPLPAFAFRPQAPPRPDALFPRPPYPTDPRPPFSDPRPPFSDPRAAFSPPRPAFPNPRPAFSDPRSSFSDPRPPLSDPRPPCSDPRPPFSDSRPPFSPVKDSKSAPNGEEPGFKTSAPSGFMPHVPTSAPAEKSDIRAICSPKIKEEPGSRPHSPVNPMPSQVFIKQEPLDSVHFMPHIGPAVASVTNNGGGDAYRPNESFELVTPKLEPPEVKQPSASVSMSSSQSSCTTPSVPNINLTDFALASSQISSEPLVTSHAEVKGHSGQVEGEGRREGAEEAGPTVVEIMEESDSDREGTLTPGPVAIVCNKEFLRTNAAIFIKSLNRGEHNMCSRCDLIYKPMPDSKWARRLEEQRSRKKVTTPSTPVKEDPVKRKAADTPPPNSTADAQVISSIRPPSHHHQDRLTPRSYHDTPALRQLSEYAKPHAIGQDPRSMPGYLGGFPPFVDPIRMAAMYPPNSRERLELELERDKRERDARERELREHELRHMEMREKLKAELEMKPPGLERLLPPGANPLDPHWMEIQRRYGHPLLQAGASSHLPGVYPPTSLASDLMARERERLERLGIPPGHPMLAESSYTAAMMERLSAERMSAERLSAERLQAERQAMQDPMLRLQMSAGGMNSAAAAAALAAAQHAHTHAHTHSHTHLHLHQPDGSPVNPNGPPIPTSSGLHPLLPPHLLHAFPPGADPMSGVNGTSNPNPPGSMPSLPVGMPPHLLASREQELMQSDIYRRAYTDPAIAQQLQQAHHEALQRMVMERERFGSGHLPPPH